MLGTVLLKELVYLILIILRVGTLFLHFSNEETETQKDEEAYPQIFQLVMVELRFESQHSRAVMLLELGAIEISPCVGPGKSNLPFELRRKAGDSSRVTAGPIDLI